MTTDYIEPPDDDMPPFNVLDDIDVGDLSSQEGGVLPASSRVVGEVRRASIKRNLENNKYRESPDNLCTFKSLHLEIAIGATGLDGEGAYAGKMLFADLIVAFDAEACKRKAESHGKKYNAHWWEQNARFPLKEFIRAIGGDVKNVRINDEFLLALVGQHVMFDIKRVKDSFRGEGEFRNELANWRAVETSDE